jgi:hypothetical protein
MKHDFEVDIDESLDTGSLNLDGDILAVKIACAVYLADGADARGVSSKIEKTFSRGSRSSDSTIRLASSNGKGGTSSCSFESSWTKSNGTRSGRVERI